MSDVITPPCVLSFPALVTPKERAPGGGAVFSAAFLFDKKAQATPEYAALKNAAKEAAIAKFGEKVNLASLTMPFRDGNEKADRYQGYEDRIFINAWSKQRPGLVDKDLQPILDGDDIYAGQIVRAQLTAFAWTNSGKKGVSFGISNVQVLKNAPRIDGRAGADKVFSVYSEDDAA